MKPKVQKLRKIFEIRKMEDFYAPYWFYDPNQTNNASKEMYRGWYLLAYAPGNDDKVHQCEKLEKYPNR